MDTGGDGDCGEDEVIGRGEDVVIGGRMTTMKTGVKMQINEEDEDHSEDRVHMSWTPEVMETGEDEVFGGMWRSVHDLTLACALSMILPLHVLCP